jgi:hypothetical protein
MYLEDNKSSYNSIVVIAVWFLSGLVHTHLNKAHKEHRDTAAWKTGTAEEKGRGELVPLNFSQLRKRC